MRINSSQPIDSIQKGIGEGKLRGERPGLRVELSKLAGIAAGRYIESGIDSYCWKEEEDEEGKGEGEGEGEERGLP